MITFNIMNRTGHSTLSFDDKQLLDAEKKFNEIMGKGYMAVATATDGSPGKAYRDFDPTIETTVFRAPLAGG